MWFVSINTGPHPFRIPHLKVENPPSPKQGKELFLFGADNGILITTTVVYTKYLGAFHLN